MTRHLNHRIIRDNVGNDCIVPVFVQGTISVVGAIFVPDSVCVHGAMPSHPTVWEIFCVLGTLSVHGAMPSHPTWFFAMSVSWMTMIAWM